jgi:glycine betaine/proline transport system substrate-binding protein
MRKTTMTRRDWLAALGVAALGVTQRAGADDAARPGAVRMGQISLSFYAVTGAVVEAVLQRLGHTVETVQGSHAQIFPRLAAGEIDLLVAAWLPHGHAMYWSQYGERAGELAVLYRGARFAWMVPEYVPAGLVSQIDDLKKPEVLERMERVIQGTGRDSGNTIASVEVMRAYGLDAAGYQLQPGTLAEFHGAYDRGIAAQRWFVMPLWWPHYINRVGNMRPLDEPRGLLGAASNGTLVASRAWLERAPPATVHGLSRMQLGLEAVADMDYRVNVRGMTPRDAAAAWMSEHADVVESWFSRD